MLKVCYAKKQKRVFQSNASGKWRHAILLVYILPVVYTFMFDSRGRRILASQLDIAPGISLNRDHQCGVSLSSNLATGVANRSMLYNYSYRSSTGVFLQLQLQEQLPGGVKLLKKSRRPGKCKKCSKTPCNYYNGKNS